MFRKPSGAWREADRALFRPRGPHDKSWPIWEPGPLGEDPAGIAVPLTSAWAAHARGGARAGAAGAVYFPDTGPYQIGDPQNPGGVYPAWWWAGGGGDEESVQDDCLERPGASEGRGVGGGGGDREGLREGREAQEEEAIGCPGGWALGELDEEGFDEAGEQPQEPEPGRGTPVSERLRTASTKKTQGTTGRFAPAKQDPRPRPPPRHPSQARPSSAGRCSSGTGSSSRWAVSSESKQQRHRRFARKPSPSDGGPLVPRPRRAVKLAEEFLQDREMYEAFISGETESLVPSRRRQGNEEDDSEGSARPCREAWFSNLKREEEREFRGLGARSWETKKPRNPGAPSHRGDPSANEQPSTSLRSGDSRWSRSRDHQALREGFPSSTRLATAAEPWAVPETWRDDKENLGSSGFRNPKTSKGGWAATISMRAQEDADDRKSGSFTPVGKSDVYRRPLTHSERDPGLGWSRREAGSNLAWRGRDGAAQAASSCSASEDLFDTEGTVTDTGSSTLRLG